MVERLNLILNLIIPIITILILWIARKPENKGKSKFWVEKSWDPDTWKIRWGAGTDDFSVGGEGKSIDETGKVDRTKDVGKY